MERLATERVGLVVGASGSGKSVLIEQYGEGFDGPMVLGDLHGPVATPESLRLRLVASLNQRALTDLAAMLEHATGDTLGATLLRIATTLPDPFLLAIDDVHHADGDLATLVDVLVREWPAPHRLLVAGRHLPDALPRANQVRAAVVDEAALAFSLDEATGLLDGTELLRELDRVDVQALLASTDRWAAALVLATERLIAAATSGNEDAVGRELVALVSEPASVRTLIGQLIGSLEPAHALALTRLAHLPWFDDAIVDRAGLPGGVNALRALGLPVRQLPEGSQAFPDSVQDVLAARQVPDSSFLAGVADHLIQRGHLSTALRILRGAGLQQQAARVLLEMPQAALPHLDPAAHAAAVAALDDDLLAGHPTLLVTLADNHALSGQTRAYMAAIDRATALVVNRSPDDPARLEVDAAQVAMQAALSDDDHTLPAIVALRGRADLSPIARARLDIAMGRARSTRRRAEDLEDAAHDFERAARVFGEQDAPGHLTTTSILSAMVSAWPLGRFDAALDHLQRAMAVAQGRLRARVAVLPFQAFVLIDIGEYARAESVLGELRRTAALASDDRAAAYARWAMARMASQRGEAESTAAHCAAIISSPAVLDTGNGAFVRADVAQLLARVGDQEAAERHLAYAWECDPGTTVLVPTADLVVAAHAGDLHRVEQRFEELDGGQAVEPRDRWRLTLLHAWAAHRAGDASAAPLAGAAFEQAAQLGAPNLPLVRERRIAAELGPIATSSSPTAADLVRPPGIDLQLFGEVSLDVAGRRRHVTGRPAQLLAFLALHGPEQPTDVVLEAMWPGTDPARGRQRLRTVLARTRRLASDIITRRGDTLRLHEHVDIDTQEFRRLAQRARQGQASHRVDAARAALALYRDTLAPQVPSLEWVEGPRRQFLREAVGLLDLLADEADVSGRTDDAIRSLLDAIDLEPTGEQRYVRAARLLARQGWRARAMDLLARARREANMLGVPVSPALERLEGQLQSASQDREHAADTNREQTS